MEYKRRNKNHKKDKFSSHNWLLLSFVIVLIFAFKILSDLFGKPDYFSTGIKVSNIYELNSLRMAVNIYILFVIIYFIFTKKKYYSKVLPTITSTFEVFVLLYFIIQGELIMIFLIAPILVLLVFPHFILLTKELGEKIDKEKIKKIRNNEELQIKNNFEENDDAIEFEITPCVKLDLENLFLLLFMFGWIFKFFIIIICIIYSIIDIKCQRKKCNLTKFKFYKTKVICIEEYKKRKEIKISYARIEKIKVRQNLIEKLFGIGNIELCEVEMPNWNSRRYGMVISCGKKYKEYFYKIRELIQKID